MTTLDDIAGRDAESPTDECESCREYAATEAQADRRYLLGLVREAREALWAACDCPRHGDLTSPLRNVPDGHQPYCNTVTEPIAGLLTRLTEGSDRT